MADIDLNLFGRQIERVLAECGTLLKMFLAYADKDSLDKSNSGEQPALVSIKSAEETGGHVELPKRKPGRPRKIVNGGAPAAILPVETKKQIETEPLITVERAAALLGCSRTKIYNLHRDGLLELRKLGYRSTRVTQASVDRLIADPSLMKSRPMPIVPAAAPSTSRRLGSPEAAEYLGISVHSLFRLRESGEGPAFMKIGQILRYDTRELDAWMAKRKTTQNRKVGTIGNQK